LVIWALVFTRFKRRWWRVPELFLDW